jgi:hypothetical protein
MLLKQRHSSNGVGTTLLGAAAASHTFAKSRVNQKGDAIMYFN